MKNKTILVTGSLGYIGTVLTPHLIDRGYKVLGLDTGFFNDCKLYEKNDTNVLITDMRNFDKRLLDNIDVVVHLASIAYDPFGNLDPKEIYDPITKYSLSLAKLCKEKKIKFIWPSSCSVYGISNDIINEESILDPQTAYSKNKVDFEKELIKISDKSFQPIILRLATLYGFSNRIRFDLVLNMFAGMSYLNNKIVLNSNGQSWRPVVHINDVVKAITTCIKDEPVKQNNNALILNVGCTEDNYKIVDIAKKVSDANPGTNVEFINYQKDLDDDENRILDQNINDGIDVRTYRVSFEKIKEIYPNFSTDWNIVKGVTKMLEKFDELNLQSVDFNNSKFYRLKTMEKLYQDGLIDAQLNWINEV